MFIRHTTRHSPARGAATAKQAGRQARKEGRTAAAAKRSQQGCRVLFALLYRCRTRTQTTARAAFPPPYRARQQLPQRRRWRERTVLLSARAPPNLEVTEHRFASHASSAGESFIFVSSLCSSSRCRRHRLRCQSTIARRTLLPPLVLAWLSDGGRRCSSRFIDVPTLTCCFQLPPFQTAQNQMVRSQARTVIAAQAPN